MNVTKSIYPEIYEYYDKNRKTKIGNKVFNVLNEEGIAGIILYGDIFWFESYAIGNRCSQDVYEHIKKTLRRKGYKYLHDWIDFIKNI